LDVELDASLDLPAGRDHILECSQELLGCVGLGLHLEADDDHGLLQMDV
jgi:hypothetical protein